MSRQKVYFKTFGCRTNQFDTQVMMSRLKDFELCLEESEADVVVVNSCTVTNGADATVRGYINALRRRHPEVRVVLAGCGAHSKGEELLKQGKVHGVMGHSEKERINEILHRPEGFYEIGDLEHVDSTVVSEFVGKSRAFIKIQEGCNFRCSYCIIPFVRGNARSHDEEQILEQVRRLAANGFGEFILTGTNVGSYGRDRGTSLAKLLKRMSQIRGVRRIRIGSLEPIQIDAEFMELLAEPWMARHLHIALQHTSDRMLELMNRRNRYPEDLKLFETLAAKGYALGTDFIVGHPGEGEAEWREAMERIDVLPLTHIHAFTYSPREGTASTSLELPRPRGDVAKARHRELTEAIRQKNLRFRRSHNEGLTVLVETQRQDGLYQGFDQYYNKVLIESSEDLNNTWVYLAEVEAGERENHARFTL
ncbi:tRNA (N(6)-L-threonylcarbamoyladenosine(37)-C(2))-methylthiotransferase MtaB [Nitratifractor salsuginis]|uniref:MiaB-like tRNA modifying enzyme n=1 Tax=Nitratifractor salsuginis (strain DSM 16511 / JCM 12458 / E9I37-1) TaxID=749222 RepID=E6WYV3_NITSE|nr:tRNA (N(6)-L-threonylcarbamoyladenosine(37)-C(2))-methylthiotransferase MtaB [Nitratifractor salsuginis]ADV46539.1 MiaB-like tRNA modifying enzyme [Nitratifractor salsuginis DSM 16511]